MELGRTTSTREAIDDLVRRAFVIELSSVVALFVGFYAFTTSAISPMGSLVGVHCCDSVD